MPLRVTTVPLFTPYASVQGFQEVTNGAYVTGWAWDRNDPTVPLPIAIYDGNTLLATTIADRFRKDLRDAGKGNGCHGFVYPLCLRDRKAHRITVQVAGSGVFLRDLTTGGLPRSVSRRDQPTPPPLPHFSLPPAIRWFYYSLLPVLLRPFPRPIYRVPAAVLAALRTLTDRDGRRLDRELLSALGLSCTVAARIQMQWSRCYGRQTDLLLVAQGDRLTPRWAAKRVRVHGVLPPGGAILVSVHHTAGMLAHLTLANSAYRLGSITAKPRKPSDRCFADPTLRLYWDRIDRGDALSFGDRQFTPREAGRKGLHLLAEGGCLLLYADEHARREPFSPLLGRAMTVPRGAVWFAQRSHKPIIPYMVIPDGRHWRLWLGEPIAPTQDALCQALETCIRQAPSSWDRIMAMAWLRAPAWNG